MDSGKIANQLDKQLFLTSVKLRLKFGRSRSLAGQFGFGLTETEYLQMTLRLPLKEAEYSASAPVSAELFGFVCSLQGEGGVDLYMVSQFPLSGNHHMRSPI